MEEDPDYSMIARYFGYKSSMIRDIDFKENIYEVYEPILKQKGIRKLKFNQKKHD